MSNKFTTVCEVNFIIKSHHTNLGAHLNNKDVFKVRIRTVQFEAYFRVYKNNNLI